MSELEARPWMAPSEISQVLAVLLALGPRVAVEFGAGGSSLYFPPFVPRCQWLSIEHVPAWAEKVGARVPPNVTVQLVRPDVVGDDAMYYREGETDARIFDSYIRAARRVVQADFVLVDGRARNFAIEAAASWLLRPGGVLVVHDAQRCEYQARLKALGAIGLVPWSQGQVAIWRKPLQR